jgi:hypothetical protein
MKPLLCLSIAVALAAGLSAPVHAQWKWKDPSGRVTVSDMPPPREIADKDILQRPSGSQRRAVAAPAPAAGPASAAGAEAAPRVDPELEARRKKVEAEQAAQKKAEEEKHAASRAENCQRAQAHLRSIDSGMRIARVNDKGEREILDDKQLAEEKQRARSAVSSHCN